MLQKSEEKAHLFLGLKTAVENIDSVVSIIKKAVDSGAAAKEIREKYELSEKQAKVFDMRLARLTSLETQKIFKEYQELLETI